MRALTLLHGSPYWPSARSGCPLPVGSGQGGEASFSRPRQSRKETFWTPLRGASHPEIDRGSLHRFRQSIFQSPGVRPTMAHARPDPSFLCTSFQYGIHADVHIRQDSRPAERQILFVHVGLLSFSSPAFRAFAPEYMYVPFVPVHISFPGFQRA